MSHQVRDDVPAPAVDGLDRVGPPLVGVQRVADLALTERDCSRLAEWSELAAASENVFATPEFIGAWHTWAGEPPSEVYRLTRPDGTVAGVIPLVRDRRGPLRIIRFAGHGPADLLGPVGAPEDTSVLADGLRATIDEMDDHDLFVGERLPGSYPWAEALDATELGREGFPIVRMDPAAGWDGWLARLSRRLRKELRHDERALRSAHDVRLRTADGSRPLDEDLDEFLRLHGLRWPGNSSSLTAIQPFLRTFAPIALERGWLRLAFLELDGRSVAARLDLRYGRVHAALNGGWDPAFADEAVGLVIRAQTMRLAMEEGATEYRFLRGNEPYKYRFADEDPELVTVIRARTAVGSAVLAAVRAASRHDTLRRFLRRLA